MTPPNMDTFEIEYSRRRHDRTTDGNADAVGIYPNGWNSRELTFNKQ